MSKQGVKLSFFTSVFVMGVISACDRSDQDALLQRNRSGQEQNQQSTGSGNRRLPVNSNINNEGPNFADSSFALADIALAQKPTTTFRSEKFKNKYFNIGDFYDLNNWNATWYKSLYDGHLVYTVNCSNSMKAFYWKKQNNKCDATHLFADFSEQNYMFDTYSSAEDIYSMAKALTQYFEYSDSANPNFDLINQSNHPLASNPNFNEEYWLKGKYNWHIIAKDGIYYVRNGAAIPIVRFGYDLEERFPLYYILIGKDPSLISPKDSKVKIFKIIRDFETIKVFGENLQLLEATEGSDTRDIQRHRIFKMISYYAPDRTELVNSQTKQVVVSNKLINQINTGTVEVVHHGSGVYQFSIPIAIDAKSIVTVGGRTCEASVDELSNRSGRKCLFEIQNPPLLKALPVTVRSESNEITASFNLFFKKPEVDRVDFSVREGEIDYYGPSYNFPWIRYRSPDFSQGPKFEGLDCQIATWENSLYDDTGLVKSNKTFVTINPKNKRIGQYGEMYCRVPENIYSALSKKFNGSVFRNVQVSTERDSLKIDLPISGNKISELANKEIARSGSSVKISYGNLFNNRFLSPITAIDFGFNKDYMVETRWGQISTVLAPYLYMDYIVLGSQYLVTKGGVLIQRLGSSENPIFETFMDQRPDVPIFRNLKFRQSADLRSVELEFRLLTKETLHKLDFKVVGTTDLYQCDFTSNVLASDREMYSGCAIAISGTPRKIGSFAEVKFTFKGGRTQTEVARREVRRRTGDGDMLMNHELYDNLLSEGAVKQVIGVKEDGLIVVPNVPEESDVDLIAGGANCKRLKVSRDRDLGFQRLCVAKVPSSGDRGFIAKINGRVAYRSFSPTLDNTEESQDRIDVLRSRVRDYAPLGDDENVIVHMAEDNSFLNLEMLYYVDSFYNKKYPCKPMYEDFDAGINNEGQNVGKFKLATHCKLKRSDSGVVENLSREYVFSSGVTVSARPSWHYSKDHDLNGWPEDNYVQVTEIDNLFFVQQGSTSSPNTSCSQICDEYLPKALVYKSALNTENNCKLLYDKIKRPVSNYGHGYALEVFEIPSAGSYGNGCATVKRKTKATSPFDIDEQTVYSFKPYNEKDLGPSTNLLNPYSQQLKICPCVSKN